VPAQPAVRLVVDVIRFMRGAVSNLATAINYIMRTCASVVATILDLAGSLITVRPASSNPNPHPKA